LKKESDLSCDAEKIFEARKALLEYYSSGTTNQVGRLITIGILLFAVAQVLK
jgi:hypothetical protein